MMQFSVPTAGTNTRVIVRRGGLAELATVLAEWLPPGRRVLVVSDETVWQHWGAAASAGVAPLGDRVVTHLIPAGEASKSLADLQNLYRVLADGQFDRDALLLAVGGGVVSDLAGFAAATWKRGAAFAICPTTVESAVDACLGGKTGINLPQGKNLVGAFHPPAAVLADPSAFSTLDPRDVRAGLAECVKHSLLAGEEEFVWLEEHAEELLRLDEQPIDELVERNLRIKGDHVSADPFETLGRRAFLNLGHTIGHAIESVSDYALRHGECVSLGLIAALELSRTRAGLDEWVSVRTRSLLQRLGLPVAFEGSPDIDAILAATRNDKKSAAGKLRFVLLDDIASPVLRDDIGEGDVRAAIRHLLEA